MTEEEFVKKLSERGIEAEIQEGGLVALVVTEKEYAKRRKRYEKAVKETGWNRSWAIRVRSE